MRRLATMLTCGAILFVLSVGVGSSQDTKKGKGKMNMLPDGWKALNLTAEQKAKVYDIQNKSRAKIDQLEEQIKTLRAQVRQDSFQILTDDQKAMLRKNTTGDDLSPKTAPEKKEKKDTKYAAVLPGQNG